MSLRLLALAATLSSGSAFSVTGLYRWPSADFPPVCGLFLVDSTSGSMTLVANTSACEGISSTFPAFSCRGEGEAAGALAVAISSAPSVSAVDLATGATRALAPMPGNASDALLGLVCAGGRTLLVTQSTLYEAASGALTPLAAGLGLPELAIVAAQPGAGTGGAPLVFVADEGSAAIAVIDAGATPPAIIRTIKSSISAPWDMLWDEPRSRLLVLAGYRLYAVDAASGKTTTLMNIPDGPGYPKVYGATGSNTFYFFDFTFMYTVDLSSNKVVDQAPFTASPRTIGLPGPIAVAA